jgi:hypothetical protein
MRGRSKMAEEVGDRRNRRRTVAAGVEKWRCWLRFRTSLEDSLHVEGRKDDTELMVASDELGDAEIGGAMVVL